MRIGIDVRDLGTGVVGVGNVMLHLLRSLESNDHENEYVLYQYANDQYCHAPNFKRAMTSLGPYAFLREQIYFSAKSYLDKLDLFHAPIHLPPFNPSGRTKVVFTVHDLHSELDAPLFPKQMNAYFQNRRIQAIRKADHVIVHSDYVRQKVLELSQISEKKISMIPLGISESFKKTFSREELSEIRKKYRLPERFILYVGSIEPWKRVPFLINAFLDYKKESRDAIDLVLIGRPGWRKEEWSQLETLRAERSDIHWLGYVQQEDLPAIYQLGTLFCSASIWEGFGLIFLEAMATGLPVIGANHSAIPEIVGDAGLLFDATSQEDLKAQFRNLLSDEKLVEQVKEKGKGRIKQFDWEQYGRNVHRIYMSLN